jgi:hypothetical protein
MGPKPNRGSVRPSVAETISRMEQSGRYSSAGAQRSHCHSAKQYRACSLCTSCLSNGSTACTSQPAQVSPGKPKCFPVDDTHPAAAKLRAFAGIREHLMQ